MSVGLLRLHLRLARPGLVAFAGLALAMAPILIWPERLLGHPLALHSLLRLLEELLVLGVLPLTVPLWADVEGKRPARWRALPYDRGAVVLGRLVLPLVVYGVLAGGMAALGAVRGEGGPWSTGMVVRLVALAVPAAAWLGALASFGAVLARSPVAGAGAALAWWALEAVTAGEVTGSLYLFAANGGLREAGLDPGQVILALATGQPLPALLVANRWRLVGLACLAGLATAALYAKNERFLRQG